jgi:hypothetical protein
LRYPITLILAPSKGTKERMWGKKKILVFQKMRKIDGIFAKFFRFF